MMSTCKRGIAAFAVIAQLLILCPFGFVPVQADEATVLSSAPVLNETIVGTVSFQAFNFLGDNSSSPKEDGIDYNSTFYYTDDYFSRSAININATGTSMPWTALEDVSMAATSMDFAVASYTTNVGNVTELGVHSWDNTDYSNKDVNAREFLEDGCKFTDFESVNYGRAPQMDSIAYVMARKTITVFDQTTQKNKTFNLVAVGIRGAGYGAEWASNVTIGNPASPESAYRHRGFDESAREVCSGIDRYIRKHNLTENVKYWVVGFSRSAAVANLTAGYLTDEPTKYHTEQKDIYGYTFESPQAANKNEDLLKYKNIHNIINAMDAVPKVSPNGFDHRRLGVDYVMPYYGNTSADDNTAYYTQMREVLKTIALGKTVNGVYTEDPLIAATDPNNYPYNRPIPIYTLTALQLARDAFNGRMTTNFGTEPAEEYRGIWPIRTGNVDDLLGDGKWYIDRYIDELINVFLVSDAWDAGDSATENITTHRTRFIQNYQDSFRTLFGYLLGFSGPPFLSLVNEILTSVQNQIRPKNLGNLTGFLLSFSLFYASSGTIASDGLKTEAKSLVKKVVNDMTKDYPDEENPDGITQAQMNQAMDKLVDLVIDLYADELRDFDSQYFGTTLHFLNEILSVHEQETVLSWIMSLDPNHLNRSYRTLTVPMDTTVELYEYRAEYAQFDGTPADNGPGILLAKCRNGGFVKIPDPQGNEIDTLDHRVYVAASGNDMVIRYPSSLDIRADVRINDDTELEDLPFQVGDYQTKEATTDVSMGVAQYQRLVNLYAYDDITEKTAKTNAKIINDLSNSVRVPMSKYDVLHIYSDGMEKFDETGSPYSVDKDIYANVIVEGQFIHDEDEVSFDSGITDDNGNSIATDSISEQFTYTCANGESLQPTKEGFYLGHDLTIKVPEVVNGHYVEKYFITDSSDENNKRLSSDNNAYTPSQMISGAEDIDRLETVKTSSDEQVLSLKDQVFHVFYSGEPEKIQSVTKIIDFNGKMILATQAEEPEEKTDNNGTFALDSDKNATYQLDSDKVSNGSAVLTRAYENTDSATIIGNFGDEGKSRKRVTVVPANNIYFNDRLHDKTMDAGDGSGYNDDAGREYQANTTRVDNDEEWTSFYLTFCGTGIDIYCTTDREDGYISAALFRGGKDDVSNSSRIGKNITIKNASSVPYFCTPTVRFCLDEYGTYTVKINAMSGSHYKLDGARVYGASEVMDQELYEGEKNARFVNLREVLANDSEDFSFTTALGSTAENVIDLDKDVNRILFIDNASELSSVSINGGKLYNTTFEAYKKTGPKSEIFLAENQAIVFKINNYAQLKQNNPEMRFMVGLRLPNNVDSNAVVLLGTKDQLITSHLDMFYEIVPDSEGVFTIKNKTDVLVSVTNLKVSGTEEPLQFNTQAAAQPESDTEGTDEVSFSISPNTLIKAAKRMRLIPEDLPEENDANDSGSIGEERDNSDKADEVEMPDDEQPVIDESEETVTPSPTPYVKPDTSGNMMQKVVLSITRAINRLLQNVFRR